LAITLQIYNTEFDNVLNIISAWLAFGSLFFLAFMSARGLMIINFESDEKLEDIHFLNKFGSYYEDFRLEKWFTKNYNLFNLFRHYLMVFVLVFLQSTPIIQTLTIMTPNFVVIGLLAKKLYKKESLNKVSIISESLMQIAYVGVLVLICGSQTDKEFRINTGQLIIGILIMVFLIQIGFGIREIVVNFDELKSSIKYWVRSCKIVNRKRPRKLANKRINVKSDVMSVITASESKKV